MTKLTDEQKLSLAQNIEMFEGGTAVVRMIEENLYSVSIILSDGRKVAELKVDDSLDDTWYGFKVGDKDYDINIFSCELFGGPENAKWSASVYPAMDGYIHTEFDEQLNVREV